MDWYVHLDDKFKAFAYRAGAEIAWNKNDAIEVCTILDMNNYTVLGTDIWITTQGGANNTNPIRL